MKKSEVTRNLEYYLSRHYGVSLRQDEEGYWIGKIEELPGCVAHGETPTQALEMLEDVKQAWLEDAIEAGDQIPEPIEEEVLPSGKWLQRVARSLHKKLAKMAKKEGVSLNHLVATLLAEAAGQNQIDDVPFVKDSVAGYPHRTMHHTWITISDMLTKEHDLKSWHLDYRKPCGSEIDMVAALASEISALPNQLTESQFKGAERVSRTKEELAYKS
jgi:antitoxin HicB